MTRNYLIQEKPDVILNLVDGSNIERNLYLTTQLTERGIPVVIALNMRDVVRKNGDHIDTKNFLMRWLSRCRDFGSQGEGCMKAAEQALLRQRPEDAFLRNTLLTIR